MILSRKVQEFLRDERALGTLEILLIAAVLIALALIFRKYLLSWFQTLITQADETIRGTYHDTDALKELKPGS
jgi:hypothetical protein